MRDYKEFLRNAIKTIEKNGSGHIEKDEIAKIINHINSKLDHMHPTVMLYGTYNSGKSTLLNALLSKEVAAVADKPETDKVTPYEWKGYKLYDTPGIDAPIEHELVSKEHLAKTELVLFVLSTDGIFEENKIYEEVIRIVKDKKPIFIILNNKNGIDKEGDEYYKLIETINSNLRKIGDEHKVEKIEEKVRVLFVNALSALNARINKKVLLEETSNIKNVEKEIEKLLRNSSGFEVMNGLRVYLNEKIIQIIECIDRKVKDPILKELQEFQSELEAQKTRLKAFIIRKIERMLINFSIELKNVINENGDNNRIQKAIIEETELIENCINEELEIALNEIKSKISDVNTSVPKQLIGNVTTDVSINLNAGHEGKEVQVVENETNIQIKANLRQFVANQGVLKEGLLQLRKMKVPYIKGRWEKTLGKWAGRAAWVIQIVMVAFDWYAANKKQRKMEEALREHAMAINNFISQVKAELSDNSIEMARSSVNGVFEPFEKFIKKSISESNENNESLNNNKTALQKFNLEMEEIME